MAPLLDLVAAARPEQHGAGGGARRPARNRRRDTGGQGRGDIGANLSSAHGRPQSAPHRSSWRSTATRWRCADDGASLLEVLRDRLGVRSPKDGCSPQGQCGCCTVLVDGQPRVACVTPARRVAGRPITTARRARRPRCRPAGPRRSAPPAPASAASARRASSAGSKELAPRAPPRTTTAPSSRPSSPTSAGARAGARSSTRGTSRRGRTRHAPRDLDAAGARATLESRRTPARRARGGARPRRLRDDLRTERRAGRGPRRAGRLGRRRDARRGPGGGRQGAGPAHDGRRRPPARPARRATGRPTLRTSWVEPAYLEPDASWCEPGGEPRTPLANGGAFGGKVETRGRDGRPRPWPTSTAGPVRVLLDREDVVRLGPEAAPGRRRRRRQTGGASCASSRTPGIAAAVAVGRSRPRRRGGRRRRAADVASTSERPGGPRRPCCSPAPGAAPDRS